MKYRRKALGRCAVLVAAAAALSTFNASAFQTPHQTRQLHLIITDANSQSLENVTADEISVSENGVPQTVESLEMLEMPAYYALVVDTSGSLRSQFPSIQDASRVLLSSNQPEDKTFILSFIDTVEMVEEPTSDKIQLLSAVSRLKINQGQTALFDAVYTGVKELQKVADVSRRKALVLITDGENRSSRIKEDELFKVLRETDIKIFILGMVEELDRVGGVVRKSPYDSSVALLERLAKETGGRVFFPKQDENSRTMSQIAHDLRRQYRLKYKSTNPLGKPTHKVEIKLGESQHKKRRKAIVRPAYTTAYLLNAQR